MIGIHIQVDQASSQRLLAVANPLESSILYAGAQTGAGEPGHHGDVPGYRLNHIGKIMNLHLGLTPLISLIAGILILVMPKLLNFIVAIYLIMIGLIGLFGSGALRIS